MKLSCIEGHAGIEGNELVDRLAKVAAVEMDDMCMTRFGKR